MQRAQEDNWLFSHWSHQLLLLSLVVRILPVTLFALGVVALLIYISLRATTEAEAVSDEQDVVLQPLEPVAVVQTRKIEYEAGYDVAFEKASGTCLNLPNLVGVSPVPTRTDELIHTFLRKRTSIPLLVSDLQQPVPDEGLLLQVGCHLCHRAASNGL